MLLGWRKVLADSSSAGPDGRVFLLSAAHPLALLAFAAVLIWLAWDHGSKPKPLPEPSPSKVTGPSLESAIAAMGQDPAEAVEP